MASVYLLCNATHGNFNALRVQCRNEHVARALGTRLSISMSPDETRAVVKVYGVPKSFFGGVSIIEEYSSDEHAELMEVMAAIAPLSQWSNPLAD
jgi:hypothetical protein